MTILSKPVSLVSFPEKIYRRYTTGIWLSFINCVVALPAILVDGSYDTIRVLVLCSGALFCFMLLRRLNNVFFLARTLFLGGIGYYPMLVKVIAGPDALFSLYEPRTQDFDIVVVMYVATSLALLGNEIGLFLGSRLSLAAIVQPYLRPSHIWRTVLYTSVPIILLVSFVTAKTAPNVFEAAYGSENEEQLLGNTQNIGIICLLAFFVASYKLKIKFRLVILCALITVFLLWGMFFRGLRQDVVTAVFGLVVCHGLVHGRAYAISPFNLFLALIFVVVVEFMGLARGLLAAGVSLEEMWALFISTLFESRGVFHFGTVSPIATTFANSVYLIETNTMDLLFGRSFAEYIPRTPPAFLFPDRPRDYAWVFDDYGLGAAGGIFELGEAYMNFGLFGALAVPAVISFLMARFFFNALSKQSAMRYFLLFAFLGIFLRGTWYQIFAFYKSFLTALILLTVFASVDWYLKALCSSQVPVRTGSGNPTVCN